MHWNVSEPIPTYTSCIFIDFGKWRIVISTILGAKVRRTVVANRLGQSGAQQLAAVGLICIYIT